MEALQCVQDGGEAQRSLLQKTGELLASAKVCFDQCGMMAASDAELIRRAMRLGGRGGDSERGICRSASGGDCAAAAFLSAVDGRGPFEWPFGGGRGREWGLGGIAAWAICTVRLKIHVAIEVRRIDRSWENVLYFRPNDGFVLM